MRGPSVLLGRSASVLALTAGASGRRRQCRSSVGPSRHPLRRGTSSRGETCSPDRPGLVRSAASRHRRSGLNFFVRPSAAAQQFRFYVRRLQEAKAQFVEGAKAQGHGASHSDHAGRISWRSGAILDWPRHSSGISLRFSNH